jgi:hypothetical protein
MQSVQQESSCVEGLLKGMMSPRDGASKQLYFSVSQLNEIKISDLATYRLSMLLTEPKPPYFVKHVLVIAPI